MSATHEQFNLDRKISIDNMVDPTGKKWEIKGQRGSSLVHARPNPDRADAQIPKSFKGQWTSPSTLQNLIKSWLHTQWNKSDEAAILRNQKASRTPLPPKQTPEESLAALDPEILAELGDVVAVKEPEEVEEPAAVTAVKAKKKVTKKKATK